MTSFWFWVLIVTLLTLGAWLFRRLIWRPVKAAMGTLDGAVHFRTYAMHVDQPSMGQRFGDLLAALGTGLDRYMDGRPGGRDAALPGWTISALDRSVMLVIMVVVLGPLITWAVLGHGGTGGAMVGLVAEARDGARLAVVLGTILLVIILAPLLRLMQPDRKMIAKISGFILMVLLLLVAIILFALFRTKGGGGFSALPLSFIAFAAGFMLVQPAKGLNAAPVIMIPIFMTLLAIGHVVSPHAHLGVTAGLSVWLVHVRRDYLWSSVLLVAIVGAVLWYLGDVDAILWGAALFISAAACSLLIIWLRGRWAKAAPGFRDAWLIPVVLALILVTAGAVYTVSHMPGTAISGLFRPAILIFTLLPIPGGVALFLSQGLARRAWRQGGWRLGLWPLLTLGLVALHGLVLLLVLDGVNRLDPAAGQGGAILPLATLLSDLSQGGGVHIWLYVLLALPAWPLFLFLWAGAYAVLSTGIRFWDGWILAALDRTRAGEDAAGRVTLLILTQAGLALITVTGMVAGALYLLFDQAGLGAILIRGAGWLIG